MWIAVPSDKDEFEQIQGKYLFFSSDRKRLLTVAEEELQNNVFILAKVAKLAVGGEYVLCLYYPNDSRKFELAVKYQNVSGLKYRYWKSDADTIAGKYSKGFLEAAEREGKWSFDKEREGREY